MRKLLLFTLLFIIVCVPGLSQIDLDLRPGLMCVSESPFEKICFGLSVDYFCIKNKLLLGFDIAFGRTYKAEFREDCPDFVKDQHKSVFTWFSGMSLKAVLKNFEKENPHDTPLRLVVLVGLSHNAKMYVGGGLKF